MRIRNFSLITITMMFIAPLNIVGQTSNSPLILITYPYVEQPKDLGSNIDSSLITAFAENLPEDLETAILHQSENSIHFLSRKKLAELRQITLSENIQGLLTNAIKVVSEPFDAILFTKIVKDVALITIKAEVVDRRSTKTLSKREVRLPLKQLVDPESSGSQLQLLANELVKDIVPQRVTYIYRYRGWDNHRFLNYPTISSAVLFLSSSAWFWFEDGRLTDNYSKYNSSDTDFQDVTRNRIQTEKSLTRRNIAGTASIVSGILFSAMIVRDIFWHKEPIKSSEESENTANETDNKIMRFGLGYPNTGDNLSLTLKLYF